MDINWLNSFGDVGLTMNHHILKTYTERYKLLSEGFMSGEIRKNDRCFQNGDVVTLREMMPGKTGLYEPTGRETNVKISCIDTFGCQEGYVNLSYSNVGLVLVKD